MSAETSRCGNAEDEILVLPQGRTPRKRTGTKENYARSRTSLKENRPKQNWYKCELVQQRTTRSRTARVRTEPPELELARKRTGTNTNCPKQNRRIQ
uniref:Uncharacterized protein n=1 Tax=Caenorhabditis japonica TaxID=281687 RepID=A0A8R1E3L9_CAEJA